MLSAAHCHHEGTGSQVTIVQGLGSAEVQLAASVAAVHPELDLALLEVTDPPSFDFVAMQLSTRLPREGSLVQIAGLGFADRSHVGSLGFAVEEVTEVTGNPIMVTGWGSSGACAGDSGGPLLLRDFDGSVTVAGILSEGSPSCTS